MKLRAGCLFALAFMRLTTSPATAQSLLPDMADQLAGDLSASCAPLAAGATYLEHLGQHTIHELPSTTEHALFAVTTLGQSCHFLLRTRRDPNGIPGVGLYDEATHSATVAGYEDKRFIVFVRLNRRAFQRYVTDQMDQCLTKALQPTFKQCLTHTRATIRSSVVALSWAPASLPHYTTLGLMGHRLTFHDSAILISARDLMEQTQ